MGGKDGSVSFPWNLQYSRNVVNEHVKLQYTDSCRPVLSTLRNRDFFGV